MIQSIAGQTDLDTPASDSAFAICIRPASGGRQCWELLDDDGERVMHGLASDQAEALSMAHTALEALTRDDRV